MKSYENDDMLVKFFDMEIKKKMKFSKNLKL